ncbi:hypothetical protein F5884DRAFT_783431 [Xylogone sp. PMI_703]|nr:hypothetical protein F5884DRAFT_783431 [Xylogone sp. PMI_703]
MSAPKGTDSPIKSPTGTSGAESPTTARPLELDDDDVQELSALASEANAKPTTEEVPPPKPPRPVSPQQQAENTLKEAFPSIDATVIKAVLIASGGRIEPAFNALLGMTDPDAVIEPTPPPQPPRPTGNRVGSTPQSQLEADEQYARQLAEHYSGGASYGPGGRRSGNNQRGQNLRPNELHDENHSFIDDDLPVIKENLRKGFLETQSKVNGWITNLKKRLDGEDVDDNTPQDGHNGQYRSRRSGDGRQSGDYNRYDADPQVLGDDFAGMQLYSDGTPVRRPLANPDLFKPTPPVPKADGRKVSFQSGPPEEIDLYRSSPQMGAKATPPTQPSAKQSKWQPLATIDPSPMGEAEHDPFSLGDSEDEKESKVVGKELQREEGERLKQATADAMAEGIGESTNEKSAGKS